MNEFNRRKFIKTTGAAGLGLGVLGGAAFISHSQLKRDSSRSSLVNVNYENLISRADLNYSKPVKRSEEGMPIGNGRMGSLVWTTPTALKLQINRTDVFANNAASNNFFQRHLDYCGGVGSVDIEFVDYGEEVFNVEDFSQHLSCYNGVVKTRGKGIEVDIITWHEQDVMALKVHDSRSEPASVSTCLRMLRMPRTISGNHMAISEIEIVDNKIILKQRFEEDDFYCCSAVVLCISDRNIQPKLSNEMEVKLTAAPSSSPFSVFIASASSFDPDEDVVSSAIAKLDVAVEKGYSGLFESNKEWWHDYWEKAFIYMNSDDKQADLVEKHYNYYLYLMASTSRGNYPTKFNGMLWNTGGDRRDWGGAYWGANQSCLYNALFPTNRIELMDPMFNKYDSMYDSCKLAAQQQWGSEGIFLPETFAFDGEPELPEHIAAEMRDLYLMKKPWEEMSEIFYEFAFTKHPHLSRWNWKDNGRWVNGRWQFDDKGAGPHGHVNHIFSRGAKVAYQYWQKYEYTQDKEWLRNHAYPMLKGVAEFYRNYPNVRKENDGRYHIHHVNDNESIWGARNTVEEISSMKGIFPVVIKASEILQLDANMRPIWKEFVDNLSPIPTSADYDSNIDDLTWVRALEPIIRGNGSNRPDGNTMPPWFFDLCTLESTDLETMKIANATFDAYFSEGINENTRVNVLSKLPVTGTMLGRAEATKYLIPNQIETAEIEVMPNRMDLREGVQTTSAQRLGRVADAVNYALCQSVPAAPGEDPVIRVFPAFPEDWNSSFTLLNRGGFLVTSSIQQGNIEFIEIESLYGLECRLRNPWPGNTVTIYRNGDEQEDMNGDLLKFTTSKDDVYIVVPQGQSPDGLNRQILSF